MACANVEIAVHFVWLNLQRGFQVAKEQTAFLPRIGEILASGSPCSVDHAPLQIRQPQRLLHTFPRLMRLLSSLIRIPADSVSGESNLIKMIAK